MENYNSINIEKDCSALGALFQQIINDMKNSSPVWDDFLTKATKLHHALRTTLVATTAFLDAFQKVADLATNTKGATKEIGSSLTRLCIRHRSIEKKLRDFTSAILEVLVLPLQDKKEDWKSRALHLDKEHAKEQKKARNEIKRASSDTLRLQKKLKKGKNEIQGQLSVALQDVTDKFLLLEETEKNAVRQALMEQRGQFCQFLYCLKPVVDGEISMTTEVTHLQEILDNLCIQAGDPNTLPPASEQVIQDLKGTDGHTFTYQTPPSSPSSLGSRKSSMCSINSINSNSSGSTHAHSPMHHPRNRPLSQPLPAGAVRLSSVSSQDSGFTSQDALFLRPPSPSLLDFRRKSSLHESSGSSGTGTDSGGTTPSPSYPVPPSSAVSTWANWPDPPYAIKQAEAHANLDRPHTISTAYEKSHNRPALSSDTFAPPEGQRGQPKGHQTAPATPNPYAVPCLSAGGKVEGRPPSLPPPPLLGRKPKSKAVATPIIPEVNRRPEVLRKSAVYVNTRDLGTIPCEGDEASYHSGDEAGVPGQEDQTQKPKRGKLFKIKRDSHRSSDFLCELASDISQGHVTTSTNSSSRSQSFPNLLDQFDPDGTEEDEGLVQDSLLGYRDLPSPNFDFDDRTLTRQKPHKDENFAELSMAMQHLNSCTAALEESLTDEPEEGSTNSTNRLSMQCSSGYATMTTTPACSEDTLAPGMSSQPGLATIRRQSSIQPSGRPPAPPMRRNSSITGTVPVLPPNVPKLPGHDGQHRRSHSEDAHHRSRSVPRCCDGSKRKLPRDLPAATPPRDLPAATPIVVLPGKTRTVSESEDRRSSSDTDSVDNLPLPPPPEELVNSAPQTYNNAPQTYNNAPQMYNSAPQTYNNAPQTYNSAPQTYNNAPQTYNGSVGSSEENHYRTAPGSGCPQPGEAKVRRQSSLSATHGKIISALNEKLGQPIYAIPQSSPSQPPASLPCQQQPIYMTPKAVHPHIQPIYAAPYAQSMYVQPVAMPTNEDHYQSLQSPDDTDEITPTGDPPQDGFLSQIKRGVSLRKTNSNDRSAPHFIQ